MPENNTNLLKKNSIDMQNILNLKCFELEASYFKLKLVVLNFLDVLPFCSQILEVLQVEQLFE